MSTYFQVKQILTELREQWSHTLKMLYAITQMNGLYRIKRSL